MKKYIAIIFLLQISQTFANNQVINGNFNNGIVDWSIFNSPGRSISWVQNDGNTALGSIEVSTNNNNGGAHHSYSGQIPVDSTERYHLITYVKPLSTSQVTSAVVWIEWLDANAMYVGLDSNYFNITTATANDNWTLIDEEIDVPANMKYAVIHLGVIGLTDLSSGISLARFDDISLEYLDLIHKDNFE